MTRLTADRSSVAYGDEEGVENGRDEEDDKSCEDDFMSGVETDDGDGVLSDS